VIYKDRGNLEQAVHHYSQALAANPSFSQTLNNCAVIYTMLGKLDEAFDFCTRAIRSNPNYAEAHNNLVR
jgi:tetratricopeptide (TPR) repeat protein